MHRSLLQVSVLTALLATLVFSPTPVQARIQTGTPAATTRYEVTDLGTLGGTYSEANGLNTAGQVVGSSTTVPGQEPYGLGTRAFLWTDGTMTDLGTLGGEISWAIDINDAGQVVGSSETAEGTQHAVLWTNGEMMDLGTLGEGSHSEGIRLNALGQVVGHATTGPGQELLDPGTRAFLWSEGEMTDLGTLGGDWSRATDITDTGRVSGTSETADGVLHPFVWENGTMTDLGVLPGFAGGRAIRISEEGGLSASRWIRWPRRERDHPPSDTPGSTVTANSLTWAPSAGPTVLPSASTPPARSSAAQKLPQRSQRQRTPHRGPRRTRHRPTPSSGKTG